MGQFELSKLTTTHFRGSAGQSRFPSRAPGASAYCGDQDHPVILYDYTATRERARPEKFLEGYIAWRSKRGRCSRKTGFGCANSHRGPSWISCVTTYWRSRRKSCRRARGASGPLHAEELDSAQSLL